MPRVILAFLVCPLLAVAKRQFDERHGFLDTASRSNPHKVSSNMRGTSLHQVSSLLSIRLQETNRFCQDPYCAAENRKVLFLLISLSATILLVICAFSFFREDREEQITPLCPQLVVKDSELKFSFPALPLFTEAENLTNMDVMDNKDNCVCKISMDWPDPFRGSPHGVAATVRLCKSDMTLATIVARNVHVLGQGLALCRTGCEIFGFVEPEGNKYLVRHRTGVHLLTLIGNFGIDVTKDTADQLDIWDIEGVNPVGAKVCSMKKVGSECVGKVAQHVDAGLVLCAIMATYVHRRLQQPWSATTGRIATPMASLPASPEVVSLAEHQGRDAASIETAVNLESLSLNMDPVDQLQAADIVSLRSPTSRTREPDTSATAGESSETAPNVAG